VSEQEINYQFGVIREFIEHALETNAHPNGTQAIATTVMHLENLRDKMLEMTRVPRLRSGPRIITKRAA
jgi:hypothetical protein